MKFNLDQLMQMHQVDMLSVEGYKELVSKLHIALMDCQCKLIDKGREE